MSELPTVDDVYAVVVEREPCSVMDVLGALDLGWPARGTVRNRLYDLIAQGRVVVDDMRPMRFAVNHIAEGGYVSARCNAGRHDLCNVVGCGCECHEVES